ncbi:MAG: APC family permease [Ferruginibacter sp.]
MQKTTGPALKREIGASALALNAINLTIGAGIFVLPAIVAENLGPASFVAYISCGVLVILIMLCFAEVGSKITTSGGAYAYVEKAFGPLAGFLINTLFWFGFCCLADAAVINALTDMLAIWFPVFSLTYIRVIFFIASYALLSWVNIRGAKEGAVFAGIATILKLTPLLLMIIIGFFHISPGNLAIKTWPGISSIGDTSLILFFAFMGTESALSNSGEIKDPQKNIPKGIFWGVMGVLIMYLLLQFVSQGVMGDQLPKFKDAPLAAMALKLIGPVGGTIILITSVVSMFGMLSGDVLATPRILFAASRDQLLPGFLGKVHSKYSTPYWSIIVYSLIVVLLASSGGFKQLAVLASSSVLFIYLAVVLATIRLRYKKEVAEKEGFKIPGGLTVPILAICTIGWFLSHITKDEIKGFAIFFVLLTLVYFIRRELRKKYIQNMNNLK